MKRFYITLLIITIGFIRSNAQTFSDGFESYTPGSKLAASSTVWKTWTLPYTATEDVTIINTNAFNSNQSIFFTSTNGGPTDIILPFENVFNTGQFEIGMKLNVTSGKQGYFNLQKTSTPGQIWALDATFKADATLEITNNGSILLSVPYTQGTWFDFVLSVNLNNSEWQVKIDGNLVGTFQNTTYEIASMNLFAIGNSSFYVDDVNYTHTPYTAPQLNASLTILNIPNGLVGQSVKPTFTIRNLGIDAITSYKVDVLYNGSAYNQTITGLSIAGGNETQLTFDQSIILVAGSQPLTGHITLVNNTLDDDTSDNDKIIFVNPIQPATGKIVVAEEGTGTWCGWCPRGAVFMDNLTSAYGEHFAGIAVHNADPMTIAEYDTPLGASFSGYPSALIDRGNDIDPSAMEASFITRVQIAPKAVLLNGANYDAVNGTLSVSIKTTATQNFTGNYKIACVLTENHVKGTGNGWAQSNYYSGGSNGVMGGYELLPNPVPANLMIYNHVARAISPSFTGEANAFGTATTGNEFIHNFTFSIPAAWNIDSMHIIGLFISPNGQIDNASNSTVQQAITNGYLSGTNVGFADILFNETQQEARIYPNPTEGLSILELDIKVKSDVTISISRMDGVIVQQRTYQSINGIQQVPMQTDQLTPGSYVIQIAGSNLNKQLILIKK
ncbi:MAG: Omp28-related outer membrane protein [Bacteroidota bacterium]